MRSRESPVSCSAWIVRSTLSTSGGLFGGGATNTTSRAVSHSAGALVLHTW